MAFGIGTNASHPEHIPLQGIYQDVAVKCWFTATGRSMPLMMKLRAEDSSVIEIHHIHVLTTEKQFYCGILNWKYKCRALYRDHMIEFILLFCPEDCSWKLVHSRSLE